MPIELLGGFPVEVENKYSNYQNIYNSQDGSCHVFVQGNTGKTLNRSISTREQIGTLEQHNADANYFVTSSGKTQKLKSGKIVCAPAKKIIKQSGRNSFIFYRKGTPETKPAIAELTKTIAVLRENLPKFAESIGLSNAEMNNFIMDLRHKIISLKWVKMK